MTEMRFASYSQEWMDAFSLFLDEYLKSSSSNLLGDYRNFVVESEDFTVLVPDTGNEFLDFDMVNTELVVADDSIWEGAITQVLRNEYERNPEARKQCIAHYGTRCVVCGFDFEEVYGVIGRGYIIVPLAEQQGEYQVDPVMDLRPVCPNCHAMLHRKTPPYSIDELNSLLQRK